MYFDLFQNGMLALGVSVAAFSVVTARSTARKKQTADLLLQSRGDDALQVGIGIRAGIYDEEMVKNCWYTAIVQTYDKTRPLIAAARERTPKSTSLQEFEWLAKRWKKNPLRFRAQP